MLNEIIIADYIPGSFTEQMRNSATFWRFQAWFIAELQHDRWIVVKNIQGYPGEGIGPIINREDMDGLIIMAYSMRGFEKIFIKNSAVLMYPRIDASEIDHNVHSIYKHGF